MEKIIVGKIINTHGIAGELKVQRTNKESFDRDISYFIDGFSQEFKVEKARVNGDIVFVKLEGYDNINDVLIFKHKYIRVDEEELYSLSEDEFFIKDLIGLEVYNEEGILVGNLTGVDTYAANDIYLISTDEGQKSVPAVKEFIKEIDLDNRKIVINFIEGM